MCGSGEADRSRPEFGVCGLWITTSRAACLNPLYDLDKSTAPTLNSQQNLQVARAILRIPVPLISLISKLSRTVIKPEHY